MVAAERLVLRLEPRSLDLATALPLLGRHRLHSALLAVRASRGDYVSSVEEVNYCSLCIHNRRTDLRLEILLFFRQDEMVRWALDH